MDYLKKSRIEEVLIAILGKGTVTSQLISRIEKILDAIRVKGSYDGITMSEVEEILVCILLGKRFEKPTHSRIAAMLKVKANGGEYTELRKSRVEELIFEWINAVESATYTGTLPTTLQTVEGYLESYKIYGNTVQDGTPTPENPIVPQECGERTAQLWDEEYLNGYYTSSNAFRSANNQICTKSKIAVKPNTAYWFGATSRSGTAFLGVLKYNENAEFIERENTESYKGNGVVFTTDASTYYINVNFGAYYGSVYKGDIVIAESSTALPYEPYGYKLPILSNSTVTNIYLGEVETTRKVKKLVLTGEETFDASSMYYATKISIPTNDRSNFVCSHFKAAPYIGIIPINSMRFSQGVTSKYDIVYFNYDSGSEGAENFKSYLAAQYAAGTPVTVWYVLAEPETAVVNEPLMKIGDYADTIDSTQTSAQIPTAAGETTISWAGEGLAPSEVELTYLKQK